MERRKDEFIPFTPLHALFLACSIITYLADITLDVILTITYLVDGLYWYAFITFCLVFFPTVLVQIFSIRWHQIDEEMNNAAWVIHSTLLGVLHRYVVVISLGFEAMKSNDDIDYQRFYNQQSDVCMLRLFDSFLESAPQLVFHLYVMIERAEWPIQQAVWTGLSAIMSMVSLGWGIAAYSSAMRMTRSEKRNMTWTGMILQTVWRFGMLTARISALLLLSLVLHEWLIICLFIHWLVMTLWVVWQNTDFCNSLWEERLYNAIVGVIYCFCFFNLKEGQSRYRATIFYSVIIVENFACAIAYYIMSDFPDDPTREGFGIGGFAVITAGTILGLTAMLLYYGFFHPAGPINPCHRKLLDNSDCENEKSLNKSTGPDFVIEDYVTRAPTAAGTPQRKRVQHSRSFKDACPPSNRFTTIKRAGQTTSAASISPVSVKNTSGDCRVTDSAYGTSSNRTVSRSTASPYVEDQEDSLMNRSESSLANGSGSSKAYNNETYMSIEDEANESASKSQKSTRRSAGFDAMSQFSQCSQTSVDSRVTVIDRSKTPEKHSVDNQPEKLLKRSPIVKDVTSGFAQVTSINSVAARSSECNKRWNKNPNEPLTAPLTILIPNISHQAFARCNSGLQSTPKLTDKTISLDVLNPLKESLSESLSAHDYENLALVNINRATLGVSHWRTYSDMANDKHDESTAYDRKKTNQTCSDYSNYASLQYYDIYPLSKEMKEQLYRSMTPSSTAATVASDSVANDSDTYEPIEAFSGAWSNASDTAGEKTTLPLTLIHHDGHSMVTKQIVSLENLKEVLKKHESVPMDDPQDRGDLYLLAPMRLLTPILEESEHDITRRTESTDCNGVASNIYADFNRSILTVISEILGNSFRGSGPVNSQMPRKANDSIGHYDLSCADGHFADSVESTSSLVHTIDEIRNTSLCNLFFSSFSDSSMRENPEFKLTAAPQAAPQVPPRNSPATQDAIATYSQSAKLSRDSTLNASMKSINSNTLVPSPSLSQKVIRVEAATPSSPKPLLPKKQITPLMASAGSRKNILELAGTTSSILNTPKRPSKLALHSSALELSKPSPQPILRSRLGKEDTDSSLHSVGKNFMPLSPSSKYETPTPPLRPNQFVRNASNNRPRRKFSIIKDRFESNTDLYQNISDDLLHNDLSQISKCLPSPTFIDSKDFGLKPDEKYENMIHRGWATSSIRASSTALSNRNVANRRSMPLMDKENHLPSTGSPNPPILGPKPRNSLVNAADGSPGKIKSRLLAQESRPYRVTSLSPKAKIFSAK